MDTGALVVCEARIARGSVSLWLDALGCMIRTASKTMAASNTIQTMTLVRCFHCSDRTTPLVKYLHRLDNEEEEGVTLNRLPIT